MKKKLTLLIMAVVLGLLLTSQAFAWGPGRDRGFRACCNPDLERLNLTDEQKTKIEALRTAAEKDLKPIRQKLFDKSVELRRLWLQVNPDKDKIIASQKEIRTLRDSMQDKMTVMHLEIRKELTADQNEKVANMNWGRGPGFGPRGGRRGPGEHFPGMGMCQ